MSQANSPNHSEKLPEKVKFDYMKSNHFRVVHADGAVGGITPKGYILMSIFSTRLPIPKQVTHKLEQNGLGEELLEERISRDAIVREVEVGVLMDAATAESIGHWLLAKAKERNSIKKGA